MTKNNKCPNCDAPLQAIAPKDASPECPSTAEFQSADGGERNHGEMDRRGGRTKSERSKLALWGLLLPILAVGLSIPVTILLSLALDAREGGSWSYIADTIATLAGLAVLTGVVFSIVALVRIQRSRGRLHGRWMAIAGVLMPLLFCIPVTGLVHFAAARAPLQEPDPSVLEPAEETGAVDPARRLELVDETTGTREDRE
jgi:hypothetical protein